jgi:hypothetical protein
VLLDSTIQSNLLKSFVILFSEQKTEERSCHLTVAGMLHGHLYLETLLVLD